MDPFNLPRETTPHQTRDHTGDRNVSPMKLRARAVTHFQVSNGRSCDRTMKTVA